MGWIISPSEDVENYDDGSFKLPCRTSNVTYSITYVSPEGCSSNTVSYTYVTSGDCETPPPPVGTCPASGDVIDPYGARDSGAVWVPIMRVLKNDTYTGYTFTSSDEGKVGSISLGSHTTGNWYLVNAQLSQNTGDYRRTTNVTVHMTGTETPSSGCDYTVGIVQEGSCAKLDYSRYFGPMHYDYKAPGDGDSATRGAIVYVPVLEPFSSGAWTAAFASGTGNFVRNLEVLNSGGGPGQTVSVVVDIDRNDTGAARTFDVICTGTKTDGGICSKTVTITQDPYVPPTPTCGCNSITYSGTYEADPTPVTPDDGKIKLSIDSFSGDWTPALEFHTSNNTRLISVDRYGTSTVVVKDWANVGTCSKIKFTQLSGSYTKIGVSIHRGDSFVTLLSNATIPSSSGTYLNLLTNFNVSDYSNSSNCTLKITFR